MHIRLYPSPSQGLYTPFSLDKKTGSYACLWIDEESVFPVSLIVKNQRALIVRRDESNQTLSQYRLPNRTRVLDCISGAMLNAPGFREFVETHIVVPTFSASPTEAIIRAIIRQIIRADQAKYLLARFINSFGPKEGDLRGFPSSRMLMQRTLEDYERIGLGLKSERVYEGVRKLDSKPHSDLLHIQGIGPWSRAVIMVDLEKDYSKYPFNDKSGEKIRSEFKINIEKLAKQNAALAGDLYVYAMSYFEKQKFFAEQNRVYIAYPMSNRTSDISDMDRLASWFKTKRYSVFSPHSRLFPDSLAKNTIDDLTSCQIIIADVSSASHGVGFEIGYAFSLGKEVIAVARRNEQRNVSKFIQSLCTDIIFYNSGSDLIEKVAKKMEKIRSRKGS